MRMSVLAALGAATIAVAVPAVANHHAATEALATALADISAVWSVEHVGESLN